jgi:hypothetical protein
MTQTQTILSPLNMPATLRQKEVLSNYGVEQFDGTVGEASMEIDRIATERAMQDPTPAQRSRLDYLGGKQLSGAGRREVSTSITMLTALTIFEQSGDAQALANAVRERFKKQIRV